MVAGASLPSIGSGEVPLAGAAWSVGFALESPGELCRLVRHHPTDSGHGTRRTTSNTKRIEGCPSGLLWAAALAGDQDCAAGGSLPNGDMALWSVAKLLVYSADGSLAAPPAVFAELEFEAGMALHGRWREPGSGARVRASEHLPMSDLGPETGDLREWPDREAHKLHGRPRARARPGSAPLRHV